MLVFAEVSYNESQLPQTRGRSISRSRLEWHCGATRQARQLRSNLSSATRMGEARAAKRETR